MPSLHGIEISILTQSEVGRLPEYPHPDGFKAHVNLCATPDTTGDKFPQTYPNESPSTLAKVNSDVSVYIPSVPGLYQPTSFRLVVVY